MSKITNDALASSGTGCLIAVPIWQQLASEGENMHKTLLLELNGCRWTLFCRQVWDKERERTTAVRDHVSQVQTEPCANVVSTVSSSGGVWGLRQQHGRLYSVWREDTRYREDVPHLNCTGTHLVLFVDPVPPRFSDGRRWRGAESEVDGLDWRRRKLMRCWKRSVEEDQVNSTTEQWSQLVVAARRCCSVACVFLSC